MLEIVLRIQCASQMFWLSERKKIESNMTYQQQHGLQNTHTFHWTFYINILTSVWNMFLWLVFIRRISLYVLLFMICNQKKTKNTLNSFNRLYFWLKRSRLHLYVCDRSEKIHCSFPFFVFIHIQNKPMHFHIKIYVAWIQTMSKQISDTLELSVYECVCFFFFFFVITHKS